MKITCFILAITLIIMIGCHAKRDMQQYVVKIEPVGPSDYTRMTFYISFKKTNFKKEYPFFDEILTDQNSLQNTVSFLEDNIPVIKDSPKISFGSIEISVYKSKNLMIHYYFLNGEQSKNYLGALIKSLEDKNSDPKLIKDLKQEGYAAIPYIFR